MLVGLLGGLQIAARGFALFHGRAPVGGHVAEALLDRQFLDFGGAFVGGACLVVAMHRAFPGRLVPLVGPVGALGRALHVVLGDGLMGGEFRPATQQFLGALAGLLAR